MTYAIIAACLAVGLFAWRVARKIRAKLREANMRAEYYWSLAKVWRAISLDDRACGHPSILNDISSSSPCIEEGFVYINSVPKERREIVNTMVCEELDKAYCSYLSKIHFVVKRFLEIEASDYRDEKLEYYLHQNSRWLVIEGNSPYFDPVVRKFLCQLKLGGEHGKEMRQFLLDEMKACEERLVLKRTADKAKLALANRPSKPYTGEPSVFFGNPIGSCGFAEPLSPKEIWRKIWH